MADQTLKAPIQVLDEHVSRPVNKLRLIRELLCGGGTGADFEGMVGEDPDDILRGLHDILCELTMGYDKACAEINAIKAENPS
jgi:hypothetical protein